MAAGYGITPARSRSRLRETSLYLLALLGHHAHVDPTNRRRRCPMMIMTAELTTVAGARHVGSGDTRATTA
jgi:hypothetical protein